MSENKVWTNIISNKSLLPLFLLAASVSSTYASDVNMTDDAPFEAAKVQAKYDKTDVDFYEFDLTAANGKTYEMDIGSDDKNWQETFLAIINEDQVASYTPNAPSLSA